MHAWAKVDSNPDQACVSAQVPSTHPCGIVCSNRPVFALVHIPTCWSGHGGGLFSSLCTTSKNEDRKKKQRTNAHSLQTHPNTNAPRRTRRTRRRKEENNGPNVVPPPRHDKLSYFGVEGKQSSWSWRNLRHGQIENVFVSFVVWCFVKCQWWCRCLFLLILVLHQEWRVWLWSRFSSLLLSAADQLGMCPHSCPTIVSPYFSLSFSPTEGLCPCPCPCPYPCCCPCCCYEMGVVIEVTDNQSRR